MAQSFLVDSPAPAQEHFDARNDQELIAAINRGDVDAFEALYFRYRDWVVNLANRFTSDGNAALDVMQETFLYLLRKFPGFRLTANMKTFLYPAVRNLSISARQKAARYQATEAAIARVEQTASQAQDTGSGDLATVLDSLSEEHREVLLLRFSEGLSLAEIAEAMEIPLGTVKSRLHNALGLLRKDERVKEFFEQ